MRISIGHTIGFGLGLCLLMPVFVANWNPVPTLETQQEMRRLEANLALQRRKPVVPNVIEATVTFEVTIPKWQWERWDRGGETLEIIVPAK